MNVVPEKRWDLKEAQEKSVEAKPLRKQVMSLLTDNGYPYNFDWLGIPIIQCPQDIIAAQEIIWSTKPNVIIETGVAHGGSLIFYASMLRLLGDNGKVIGVDIDIRDHNRKNIESHFLSPSIKLIQGSSTDESTLEKVSAEVNPEDRVMVVLDSNHTHEHVLKELELYSKFSSKGMYIVVMDTAIEDVDEGTLNAERPWGPGDSPKTAVWEFVKKNPNFAIDHLVHEKLFITVAPEGYLKCVA